MHAPERRSVQDTLAAQLSASAYSLAAAASGPSATLPPPSRSRASAPITARSSRFQPERRRRSGHLRTAPIHVERPCHPRPSGALAASEHHRVRMVLVVRSMPLWPFFAAVRRSFNSSISIIWSVGGQRSTPETPSIVSQQPARRWASRRSPRKRKNGLRACRLPSVPHPTRRDHRRLFRLRSCPRGCRHAPLSRRAGGAGRSGCDQVRNATMCPSTTSRRASPGKAAAMRPISKRWRVRTRP